MSGKLDGITTVIDEFSESCTLSREVSIDGGTSTSSEGVYNNNELRCQWHVCRSMEQTLEDLYDHVVREHISPIIKQVKKDDVVECRWADCDMDIQRGDAQKKVGWLEDHYKTRHNKKAKKFRCLMDGCVERFMTMKNVEDHMKVHWKQKKLAEEMAATDATPASTFEWNDISDDEEEYYYARTKKSIAFRLNLQEVLPLISENKMYKEHDGKVELIDIWNSDLPKGAARRKTTYTHKWRPVRKMVPVEGPMEIETEPQIVESSSKVEEDLDFFNIPKKSWISVDQNFDDDDDDEKIMTLDQLKRAKYGRSFKIVRKKRKVKDLDFEGKLPKSCAHLLAELEKIDRENGYVENETTMIDEDVGKDVDIEFSPPPTLRREDQVDSSDDDRPPVLSPQVPNSPPRKIRKKLQKQQSLEKIVMDLTRPDAVDESPRTMRRRPRVILPYGVFEEDNTDNEDDYGFERIPDELRIQNCENMQI